MNHVNTKQRPNVAQVESANHLVFDKAIFTRMAKLPGAIVRLMGGPPTTERQRFRQNALEARTRSQWLKPG